MGWGDGSMSLVIGSLAESCSKWNRTRREKLVGLCFASLLVAARQRAALTTLSMSP